MGKKLNIKSFLWITLISVSSLFFLSLSTILLWPQNKSNKIIKIKIEPGTSLNGISELLYRKKIIENKTSFKLAVKILGKEKQLPTGTFRFVNSKSNYTIIDQFINGSPEVVKVRILEGWNKHQLAEHLSKSMGYDLNKILSLIDDNNFISKQNIISNSLEGYLFLILIFSFEGEKIESVLSQLVNQYNKFWTDSNVRRAKDLGFSKHDITTLASIIEGEAIYDIERPKISAVYHNRLKINMKLQADPTIQYIITDGPRRLLNKDLRKKSPYNTYLHKGLPPGPINSPGKESLRAALFPEVNDFIYFVATGDGYHTFTTNERDHNKAKQKLQKLRKKLEKEKI